MLSELDEFEDDGVSHAYSSSTAAIGVQRCKSNALQLYNLVCPH
jgi:hypothetical protein